MGEASARFFTCYNIIFIRVGVVALLYTSTYHIYVYIARRVDKPCASVVARTKMYEYRSVEAPLYGYVSCIPGMYI